MREFEEFRIPGGFREFSEKKLVYDLAEDLMLFLIGYPALVLYTRFFDAGFTAYLTPLILLAGLVLSTLNRRKSKHMWRFLAFALLITVLIILFSPGLYGRILFGVISAIVEIFSILRYREDIERQEIDFERKEMPHSLYYGVSLLITGSVILYATLLTGTLLHRGETYYLCFLALAALIALYEIYLHYSGTAAAVKSGYTRASISKIKGLNRKFSAAVVAITAALTALTYEICRYIPSVSVKLPSSQGGGGQSSAVSSESASQGGKFMRLPSVKTNPLADKIFHIIYSILTFVVIAFIALMLIFAVIKLIRFISGVKKPDEKEVRQSVFSAEETIDNLKQKIRRAFSPAVFSGKKNNVRIRRLYFRYVARRFRQGNLPESSAAPRDISSKAGISSADVTEIYEKARYSLGECREDEVEWFKKALNKTAGSHPRA